MKIFYSKIARTFALLLLNLCAHISHAQPAGAVYANSQTTGGTGGTVTGETNAINSQETYATLTATTVVGTVTAYLNLGFADEITSSAASPSTVYVRVNNSASTNLLAGGVAVTAYSGTTLVSSTSTTYYTSDGKVFIAVTPTGNFKTVRVTLSSPLVVASNTLNVYYAFRAANPSNESNPYPFNAADCGQPNASTKGSSGLTLGKFDVTNPSSAIDNDLSTKSSLVSTGAALLTGHITQTFIFNGKSNNRDAVRIVLSQSGSFVKANLAGSVNLKAYNGASQVGAVTLMNSLLDVALLDLLGVNDSQVAFYYAPKESDGTPVIFDRIEIDLNIAGLGAGLGAAGVNIHDIRRVPDETSMTAPDMQACTNVGSVSLSALSLQAGISDIGTFNYAWYTDIRSGTLLSSAQNLLASGLTTVGTKTYYVQTQKTGSGCLASPRKKVTVTVQTAPILPVVSLNP
ncbi:immunoglobulin domain-containing protein [Dyadobacter luticola]|uniref:Ig-like domain-containing protein n=1 Tax=Dyadobacter luticola TaxID=1979387 RepID=A0A5R9L1Y1_9BACT|nr:hypothetical protein [Dyadobacter luticola]TLV02572.1 hypothetical protein FEN17_02830 [Dyadobacter luticola]